MLKSKITPPIIGNLYQEMVTIFSHHFHNLMFLSLNYTIFLYNSYDKSLSVVISGAKLHSFWE